jgi:predicted transcriptional regulator of viral defense system
MTDEATRGLREVLMPQTETMEGRVLRLLRAIPKTLRITIEEVSECCEMTDHQVWGAVARLERKGWPIRTETIGNPARTYYWLHRGF